MAHDAFEPVNLSYENIPWFRKRWFVVITMLIFCPATILICLTGEVYAKRKDGVYKFSGKQKNILLLIAVIFLIQGLIRLIN